MSDSKQPLTPAKKTATKKPQAKPTSQTGIALGAETADLAGIQQATANPGQMLPGNVLALQRTVGNRAVAQMMQRQQAAPPLQPKRTVHPDNNKFEREADQVANQMVSQNSSVSVLQPKTIQRKGFLSKLKKSSIFHNKSKTIIGKEKASSKFSRQETEEVLNMSTEGAVPKIVEAFSSGLSNLSAFQRVALLISGQPGDALEAEFKKQTGESLKSTIYSTFAGDPGPEAHTYLVDVMENNGQPTLKGQTSMAMGLVDSSGSVSKFMAKIPKIGDKLGEIGDAERILELFERASAPERIKLAQDTAFMDKIKEVDKKTHARIMALVHVDEAEKAIADKEKAGVTVTGKDKQHLAIARDEQLALMVQQCTKVAPVIGNTVRDLFKTFKPGPTKLMTTSFDTKKFYQDMVAWKAKATPEDLIQIKRSNSAFQKAMAEVPTNVFIGMRGKEREFILQFLDQVDTSGEETQVKAVKGSLERQGKVVGREKGSKRSLRTIVKTSLTERKWESINGEISLLSPEQRETMLKEYDPDPTIALQKLEDSLQSAGLNKEERAGIRALFNTAFGKAGDNYVALWELVEPNTRSRIKDVLGHLKPSKLKKFGEARSGKSIGNSAFKIMMELEDEEFAQVRQDKELLAKIKTHSTDKTWTKILTLLNITSETDQLSGMPNRQTEEQAREQAEFSPKHWALLFDEAIDDNLILPGVSVGREKSALFVLATKTQNAASAFAAKNKNKKAVDFLLDVLNELEVYDSKKVLYLKKRVPPVYDVLTKNAPITVDVRMARAKHEGFGVGEKLRKTDRQKVFWSFKDLQGQQLLDEWSNLHEFKGLHEGLKTAEKNIVKHNEIIANTPDQPNDIERSKKEKAAQNLQATLLMVGQIQSAMSGFTLGIKEDRRRDFKTYGLKDEDRLKFEAMVTDKLIDAMKDDKEVQEAMTKLELPYDKYMQAKMKGIDALESQRLIDTTRQWHLFSTKGSQLDEATRNVKGSITSTEVEQQKAKTGGKSKEDIAKLRKSGAEKAESALDDRTMVEARFKDMQAAFRARAMLIFKLIAMGIVTALSAGLAAPLAIGVQIGIEAGLQVLEGLYRYYVLRETDVGRLVVDAALGLVSSTVRILTGNLAFAMNASVLHPDVLGPGADWLGRPIAKSLGSLVQSTVMFMPNYIVEQVYQDKELEKVIKEGEGDIVDEVLSTAGDQVKGFVTKVAVAGMKELSGLALGGEPKPVPTQKSFGTGYTDRLAGGATTEEQEKMWARYEKEKKKDVKKQAFQVLKGEDKHTKKAEKGVHKEEWKEMRGKTYSVGFKSLKKAMESDKTTFSNDPTSALVTLLTQNKISVDNLNALTDKERGKLEDLLNLQAGQLDLHINQAKGLLNPVGG